MKKVRYYWVARVLRSFLLLGFVLLVITLLVNISASLFKMKTYATYGDFTFGSTQKGYKLKTKLRLSIPDTVINYEDGQRNIYNEFEDLSFSNKRREESKNRTIKAVTASSISSFENEEVTVFNRFTISEPVEAYVSSTNKKYAFFFGLSEQLDLLFTILFFWLLIKLLNRYMVDKIFEQSTFKLIAGFGWLVICKEIIAFIFGYISAKIMGVRFLETNDVLNDKRYNFISLSLDFYNVFSLYKVGVGLLIILIAYVIKEAIAAKKENELTI